MTLLVGSEFTCRSFCANSFELNHEIVKKVVSIALISEAYLMIQTVLCICTNILQHRKLYKSAIDNVFAIKLKLRSKKFG